MALSHLPPGSCHFGVVGAAGTELQDLYYWPVGNIHPNNLYAKVDVSEDFSSIVLCIDPLRDMNNLIQRSEAPAVLLPSPHGEALCGVCQEQ